MNTLVLVDTSIIMNLLKIPNFEQEEDRIKIESEFDSFNNKDTSTFLPIASIIESGNNIAKIPDGNVRRHRAKLFADMVNDAMNNKMPWKLVVAKLPDDITRWFERFPNEVLTGKGIGDLSILIEWEDLCKRYPDSRVKIWSVDSGDLSGYDRIPSTSLSKYYHS